MSSERQEQPADLREQLALLMRGLGTRTVLYQQFVAASHGLYNNDLKSVDILRETGPITAGELSKITGLATGTITALIDRLEKCGYVRRENDPADRRRVIIVPVYEHNEAIKNTYSPLHSAMLELASQYSADELRLIMQFIGKTSSILEEQIHHLSASRGKTSPEP